MHEIYIINGSSNRVVVYGPDFFPRMSIGLGRGVVTPRGGEVKNNGEVYLSQVKTARNPIPRISIMNGAFFLDREILLDDIPMKCSLDHRDSGLHGLPPWVDSLREVFETSRGADSILIA